MCRMWEFRVVGDDARPPWWRTGLLTLVTALGSLVALILSPWGVRFQPGRIPAPTGLDTVLILIGMVTCIALPVSLAWRHRFPLQVLAAAAVVPLVIPVGVPCVMVATAALLGRRDGRAATLAAVGGAASILWVTVQDYLSQPRASSVLKIIFGPTGAASLEPSTVPIEAMLITLLACLVVTIGTGLLIRSRREIHAVRHEASVDREATTRLGDEVARRAERERIAREVHDAMGHRLSLLNLHAGALEANAGGDSQLAESAHLVRASAGAALDDLRSLLDVLREPLGTEPPDIPLTRLAEVIDEAFGAGQPLSSSIFIADADSADPALSRAVYRIVQEVLTNARKHAPGRQVFLQVRGSRAEGIHIDCKNAYAPAAHDGQPGSSRGLAGIGERTELLGGELTYGVDDGGRTFRVTVYLPWRDS